MHKKLLVLLALSTLFFNVACAVSSSSGNDAWMRNVKQAPSGDTIFDH